MSDDWIVIHIHICEGGIYATRVNYDLLRNVNRKIKRFGKCLTCCDMILHNLAVVTKIDLSPQCTNRMLSNFYIPQVTEAGVILN